MKNRLALSLFAAVDVAAGNIAQAEFISAEHFDRKGSRAVADRVGMRRFSAEGGSALVRAVEVSGKAANFAQAEFISAEHFDRKGSQTLLWSVWDFASDLGTPR